MSVSTRAADAEQPRMVVAGGGGRGRGGRRGQRPGVLRAVEGGRETMAGGGRQVLDRRRRRTRSRRLPLQPASA